MIERAFIGRSRYQLWLASLLILIGVGLACYFVQYTRGLAITGMSRDVIWGLYIAQFTFLVGVAASAVMVVLPFYLHDQREFGRVVILGEFLAVAAVVMCMLHVFVDLGQPTRVLNVLLHPAPQSVMFWDMLVLIGYLLLNLVIGWTTLDCERNATQTPGWVKPLIYLSIPWAISIHTVTAFLYCGLPGRHLWLTALMAPRFLATAFASGPALLILLCLLMKKTAGFDVGGEALRKLSVTIAYAMILNLFFILLEFFTSFYSGVPSHRHDLQYLFFGFEGHARMVPWMWTSLVMAVASIPMLLKSIRRRSHLLLAVSCGMVFLSTWMEKGLGLIAGGFAISPMDTVADYAPTLPEVLISLGIYAGGALVLTLLYKIVLSVRQECAF
ncbi:MAG: menaquinol oxidoreductase [Verrucomicrobia bacterium]|nr:menaquinol oxidoreductase [Verrucomicrobiota bacterium]